MKKKLFSLLAISVCFIFNGSAQETFKVIFYNLLNHPIDTTVVTQENDLELILAGNKNISHNFSNHFPVTLILETNATLLNIDKAEVTNKLLLEKTIHQETLTIYINSSTLFNEELIIYNNLGQKVKTFRKSTIYEQHFDISNLENSLYLLAIPNISLKPIKFIIAN